MSKVSNHILPTMRDNPPIPFMTNLKKLEAEYADSDKMESIKFEFLVDPFQPCYPIFKGVLHHQRRKPRGVHQVVDGLLLFGVVNALKRATR
jgi:hypothetical protein